MPVAQLDDSSNAKKELKEATYWNKKPKCNELRQDSNNDRLNLGNVSGCLVLESHWMKNIVDTLSSNHLERAQK